MCAKHDTRLSGCGHHLRLIRPAHAERCSVL